MFFFCLTKYNPIQIFRCVFEIIPNCSWRYNISIMSKCKILVDCLSNLVGQNISPDLGQNNGRRWHVGFKFPCFLLLYVPPPLRKSMDPLSKGHDRFGVIQDSTLPLKQKRHLGRFFFEYHQTSLSPWLHNPSHMLHYDIDTILKWPLTWTAFPGTKTAYEVLCSFITEWRNKRSISWAALVPKKIFEVLWWCV